MPSPEYPNQETYEIHRLEEETGFKPNQLVSHNLLKITGRVRGYKKEGDKTLLVVQSPGMKDVVADTPDAWKKIKDN